MKTRKALQEEVKQLKARLAAVGGETRKNIRARVQRLSQEVQDLAYAQKLCPTGVKPAQEIRNLLAMNERLVKDRDNLLKPNQGLLDTLQLALNACEDNKPDVAFKEIENAISLAKGGTDGKAG